MIGAATIGPLLDWLEDPDPALCSAALSALVQLPLAPTAWGEVADRVLALLATGSAPMGLFAPAARVPVAEVRERLRERLAHGDPTIRRAAADALAMVGDGAAATTLAMDLAPTNAPERRRTAAELLARCDPGGELERVHEVALTDADPDVRWWTAIAAARADDLTPFRRVVRDLRHETIELTFTFGDPVSAGDRLAALAPLPHGLASLLATESEEDDDRLPWAVAELLFEHRASETRSPTPTAPPDGVPPGAGAEPTGASPRAVVEQAVGRVVAAGTAAAAPDDHDALGAWAEHEAVLRDLLPSMTAADVALLVRQLCAVVHPERIEVGNLLVEAVSDRPDVVLDLTALVSAYRRLRATDEAWPAVAWQAAWLASRSDLAEVITTVIRTVDAAADRIVAARLVEDAARFAPLAFGPIYGGGSPPPDAALALPALQPLDDLRADPTPAAPPAMPEVQAVPGAAEPPPRGAPNASAPRPQRHQQQAKSGPRRPALRRARGGGFKRWAQRARAAVRPDARPAAGHGTEHAEGQPEADEPVYALLECDDPVVAGVEFELALGLSPLPHSKVTEPQPLEPLVGRPRPYILTVHVVADGFALRDGESWRHDLAVTDDQPHPRTTIHLGAEPPDRDVDARLIEATFTVDGDVVGRAVRPLAVVSHADQRDGTSELAPSGFDIVIPAGLQPADLTMVLHPSRRADVLLLTIESPHAAVTPPTVDLPVEIGTDPATHARQLVQRMNALEGTQRLYRELVGEGRLLASMLPEAFWTALHAAGEAAGRTPTLLLLSADPHVPWELAVLPEPLDDHAPPFLAAQATVGRWVFGEAGLPPPHELTFTRMAVVTGDYGQLARWGNLEASFAERDALAHSWAAQTVDARFADVVALLEHDPAFSVVHLAVHGRYSPDAVDEGIVLVDGEWLSPRVVRGSTLNGSPFVFLNACQVGSSSEVLGRYAGMAAAFLHRGAAGVVAPLWSVQDDVAKDVAVRFYDGVLAAGTSVGEAIRTERARFREEAGTPSTFLAYQFFGHPDLRLTRSTST